jgi:hypothetical protein
MRNGSKFGTLKRGRDYGIQAPYNNEPVSYLEADEAEELFNRIFGDLDANGRRIEKDEAQMSFSF